MELGIRGRNALVTGAGRGIGRACALALAREGASVTVCARSADQLAAVVDEMGGPAAGHRALAFDLVAEGGPEQLLAALGDSRVELLVHNLGGTDGVRDAFAPIAAWRGVLRLNLEVAIELDRVLIPRMQERGDGRVVYLASLAAFEHQGSVPYSVAKAALTAYVRGIGRTVAPDGVVCSAVVPGVVLAPGGHWDEARKRDPSYADTYIKERLPRGAFGTPEEVAAAVAFLCSRQASAFHGSIVPLDGGQGRSFFGQ